MGDESPRDGVWLVADLNRHDLRDRYRVVRGREEMVRTVAETGWVDPDGRLQRVSPTSGMLLSGPGRRVVLVLFPDL